MFSRGHAGASANARVGIETGGGASPHRLVVVLYQGVRQAIAHARMDLRQGTVAERGTSASKVIPIVERGLQQAPDVEVGREVAQRLNAPYSYTARRLPEANITQSEATLVEVDGLLATLGEAQIGIAPEIMRMAEWPPAEVMR